MATYRKQDTPGSVCKAAALDIPAHCSAISQLAVVLLCLEGEENNVLCVLPKIIFLGLLKVTWITLKGLTIHQVIQYLEKEKGCGWKCSTVLLKKIN